MAVADPAEVGAGWVSAVGAMAMEAVVTGMDLAAERAEETVGVAAAVVTAGAAEGLVGEGPVVAKQVAGAGARGAAKRSRAQAAHTIRVALSAACG